MIAVPEIHISYDISYMIIDSYYCKSTFEKALPTQMLHGYGTVCLLDIYISID